MFDSLKEKLDRFKADVEAEAEVESVEDHEAEEADDGSREAGGVEATAESDEDEGIEATESAADDDAETGDAPEGIDEGPVGTEETVDGTPPPDESEPPVEHSSVSDDGDGGEDGDGDVDTGFARRARSLIAGRVVIDEEALEGPLWQLEMALLESDVEMGVAEEILDGIQRELHGETRTVVKSTSSVVREALAEALLEVISVGQFDFDERIASAEKPVVIIFTGVNGVGKTTSIAKVARYLEDRGYSSVLANGDTYRAGANEQLREHAERLDRKFIAHESGGDPAAVIYDAVEYARANDVDVVLGDTAGRLHTHRGLMDQLAKIDRVVDPDLVLFVDEAVAGQDAVRRAKEFNEAAAIDGTVLTKADADTNGGAAISIAQVTGKPILFLGTGQGYDDLEPFDPESVVEQLVE